MRRTSLLTVEPKSRPQHACSIQIWTWTLATRWRELSISSRDHFPDRSRLPGGRSFPWGTTGRWLHAIWSGCLACGAVQPGQPDKYTCTGTLGEDGEGLQGPILATTRARPMLSDAFSPVHELRSRCPCPRRLMCSTTHNFHQSLGSPRGPIRVKESNCTARARQASPFRAEHSTFSASPSHRPLLSSARLSLVIGRMATQGITFIAAAPENSPIAERQSRWLNALLLASRMLGQIRTMACFIVSPLNPSRAPSDLLATRLLELRRRGSFCSLQNGTLTSSRDPQPRFASSQEVRNGFKTSGTSDIAGLYHSRTHGLCAAALAAVDRAQEA